MQGAPHLHDEKHLFLESIDAVVNIIRHEKATLLCDFFATYTLDL